MIRRYFLAISQCDIVEIHTIISSIVSLILATTSLVLTLKIGSQQNQIANQSYLIQKFEILQKVNEKNKEEIIKSTKFFQLESMIPKNAVKEN